MVTSSLNPLVVKSGLDKLFYAEYNTAERPEYAGANDTAVFNQYDSSKGSETIAEFKGVGEWSARTELQVPTEAQPQVLYSMTYTNAALAKGVKVGKHLFDDDQNAMVDMMVRDFARKGKISRDKDAMGLYRGGFATTGGDSVAIFSASHPIASGTQSNLITTKLSESTLNTAIIALQEMKGRDGALQGNEPYCLLVSPSNFKRAAILLNSELRPNTPNNDSNWYSSGYGIYLKMSPFIGTSQGGSDDYWFLLSRNHGMLRFNHQETVTNIIDWRVREDMTYYYNGEFRQTVGAAHPFGILASTGATGSYDA